MTTDLSYVVKQSPTFCAHSVTTSGEGRRLSDHVYPPTN